MTDARFEDGDQAALRLIIQDEEDLSVLSTFVQDAVFPITEMRWQPKSRRFSLLLNRFRWEDRSAAEAAKRAYERVRSLMVIEDVRALRTSGIDRADRTLILSVLSLGFAPGEDGTGTLTITLAGDGALALDVEVLEARLEDVTRPYLAPSGKAPEHKV